MIHFVEHYNWRYPIYSLRKLFGGDIKLEIRAFLQRGKRGYANTDVWSFYTYILEILIGGLTRLKNNNCGYPGNLDSSEEWQEILQKMIIGFEKMRDREDEWEGCSNLKEVIKRQDKEFTTTWKLFDKWFFNLWD